MPRVVCFFADSSFDQSSFAPPAALTRVIMHHQLPSRWSIVRIQIPTLDVSYSKICYESYKTLNAVRPILWVLPQYNYKNVWLTSSFSPYPVAMTCLN